VRVDLPADRRARLIAQLQSMFAKEFGEELDEFKAEAIVDLMLRTLGPAVYNQAILDERGHVNGIDGDVFPDKDR
jgi:uncharacterized protein (DUF2164 family)